MGYLKKKPTENAFRGLNRIEEMFYGLPEYLVLLCEMLIQEGKLNEAKGIYIRNKLKANDFNKSYGGKNKAIGQLDQHKYVKEKDY